jgi:hypothetical protein
LVTETCAHRPLATEGTAEDFFDGVFDGPGLLPDLVEDVHEPVLGDVRAGDGDVVAAARASVRARCRRWSSRALRFQKTALPSPEGPDEPVVDDGVVAVGNHHQAAAGEALGHPGDFGVNVDLQLAGAGEAGRSSGGVAAGRA